MNSIDLYDLGDNIMVSYNRIGTCDMLWFTLSTRFIFKALNAQYLKQRYGWSFNFTMLLFM